MIKFKSFYDYEIDDTSPTILNEDFDIDEFLSYMDEIAFESMLNEFNANESAKKILIL